MYKNVINLVDFIKKQKRYDFNSFPKGINDKPGVYLLIKKSNNRIEWIGESNRLGQRIRQHFTQSSGDTLRSRIDTNSDFMKENFEFIYIFCKKEDTKIYEKILMLVFRPFYQKPVDSDFTYLN
ncbi:GIY-YIG nuclease family protein [Enterococcus avium]